MSKHKKPDPEIQKVYREEVRRRATDEELKAQAKQFERDFIRLVKEGNEKRFRAFLIAHGLHEDAGQFENALKLWREYQRQRAHERSYKRGQP